MSQRSPGPVDVMGVLATLAMVALFLGPKGVAGLIIGWFVAFTAKR